MIIFTEDKKFALNSENILFFKIILIPDDNPFSEGHTQTYALRAYLSKDDSALLTKGSLAEMEALVQEIAKAQMTEPYMYVSNTMAKVISQKI